MIQTVALMLLIAAEAALVYYNIPAMDSTVTIAGPGMQITVSLPVSACARSAALPFAALARWTAVAGGRVPAPRFQSCASRSAACGTVCL